LTVVPYSSQFLSPLAKNVKNLVVQDFCTDDCIVSHFGMAFDPVALDLAVKALSVA